MCVLCRAAGITVRGKSLRKAKLDSIKKKGCSGSLLSENDHGKRISVMVSVFEHTGDIIIKLLKSCHDDTIAAHTHYDFGHRMRIIREAL